MKKKNAGMKLYTFTSGAISQSTADLEVQFYANICI